MRRVALVTGAGQGLGRSIAERLAEGGAQVAVNDIDGELADRTAHALRANGGEAFGLAADVSYEDSVETMFSQLHARTDRLDWLVNNVGAYKRQTSPFWETDVQDWERILRVSLTSVFLCTRAAAPRMVEQGYGRVVNIASQAGLTFVPWQGPHYHAAKAGLLHLTRVMAMDLAPHGVTVNAMAPTGMRRTSSPERSALDPAELDGILRFIPVGRFAEPVEITAAVEFLLSDNASFITGETLVVNGGVVGYGIHR